MPIAFDASISLGNIVNILKTLQIFSSSMASYQSHNMTWDQKCNDFLCALKKKPEEQLWLSCEADFLEESQTSKRIVLRFTDH